MFQDGKTKTIPKKKKMVKQKVTTADCIAMYEKEKAKLYKKLDKYSSRIGLTADMWTSCQMKGYMCLTTQYIDNGWNLQKKKEQ